jgi:hypothetical protein
VELRLATSQPCVAAEALEQRSDNIRSLRFRGWTFRQKPATQGEARLQAQDIARRAPYDRVDVRHRNVASSLIACTHIYIYGVLDLDPSLGVLV